MGLDMEIRIVKKNYKPSAESYDDDNVKVLVEDCGRSRYEWLKNWVSSIGSDIYDYYDKYITLNKDTAAELLDLAVESDREIYAGYAPDLDYGIGKTIAILSLWSLYDRLGWEMQIECDW